MLVAFSPDFVEGTSIIFGYDFGDRSKKIKKIKWKLK